MKTATNWETFRESWESQRDAGRHNPARVLIFKERKRGRQCYCRHRLILSAGDGDTVDVYQEGREIIVCSIRRGLNYAGLQAYNLDTTEERDVLVSIDYDIAEVFGPRGLDLENRTVARRLWNLLDGRT